MSLYNSIQGNLSRGVLADAMAGVSSAIGGATATLGKSLGGGTFGTRAANIVAGIGTTAARNALNKYVPRQTQQAINLASRVGGSILDGDFDSAGTAILDSGLITGLLPNALKGLIAQSAYWGAATPLFGGITPAEAQGIYNQCRAESYAKKNLFLIEVSSALTGDYSQAFNLFCTELDYSPFTISGEKKRVGGAAVDSVQGGDPVELRMTTMDDQAGSLKAWFADHFGAVSAQDGTVGVPADFAITIKVVHAFITQSSRQGGYEDIGLFRPQNLDVSLSRREDGLQEIQMTFSQLDTFMKP